LGIGFLIQNDKMDYNLYPSYRTILVNIFKDGAGICFYVINAPPICCAKPVTLFALSFNLTQPIKQTAHFQAQGTEKPKVM
jgi:hypothetical protein